MAELVTPEAPILRWPRLLGQNWLNLSFLHWAVEPDSIAHLYPPGTEPDTFEGSSFVGVVPFQMSLFGAFLETNIRLYSIDDAGRHGVLFRSLEAARLAVVPVIRIGRGVPYTWAKMRMTRSGERITYHSVRRWPRRGLRSLLTITVGDVVEPTPLEIWLTARWGAHTRKGGRTWWVPNEHGPWPFRAAEIVELSDDLLGASGVRPAGERLRALYSPGVRTRFGRACLVQ